MVSEILPNLSSTVIVFFPLMVANAILLEAALGFLGRRRPAAGAVVGHDDRRRRGAHPVRARTWRSCPGVMLVLTVLALNVFGDGVRDAFDPRAKIHLEH